MEITAENCNTYALISTSFVPRVVWCLLTCWIILESFGRFSLGGTFPNNFQPGALWTAGLSSFVLLVKKFLKKEEGFLFVYCKHINKWYLYSLNEVYHCRDLLLSYLSLLLCFKIMNLKLSSFHYRCFGTNIFILNTQFYLWILSYFMQHLSSFSNTQHLAACTSSQTFVWGLF